MLLFHSQASELSTFMEFVSEAELQYHSQGPVCHWLCEVFLIMSPHSLPVTLVKDCFKLKLRIATEYHTNLYPILFKCYACGRPT